MVKTRLKVYFEDEDHKRKANNESSLPTQLFMIGGDRSSSNLICGHNSNLDGYCRGTINTDYATKFAGKLIIIYSGGGNPNLSKNDIDSERVLRILRTIDRATDGINTEEWEYIYELIDGKKFINHELMNRKLEYLPSLSILCQGYLATNSKSVDKKVKEALDQMGWNKEIHPDISNKKLETQKTSWWLEPFDNEPVDAIIAKVKKEWHGGKDGEIPNSVTEFLKRIEQDKLQYPDSTAIVANAYLAISARLETE